MLGAGVPGGVRERLLRDPVEDELDLVGEVGEVAAAPRSWSRSPLWRSSSSTWPASAALSPRSSSAVGRSWRASVRSSSIAWLASALVSASSCGELGRRLRTRRLEPQQEAGQRLVDLVVEVAGDPGPLLLLGVERGARGAAALGLQPLEHRAERALQPLRPPRARRAVDRAAAGWRRAARGRPAPSRRRAARAAGTAAGAEDVDEDGQRDGEAEHERRPRALAEVEARVAGDRAPRPPRRRSAAGSHQDLDEEVRAAHRHPKYRRQASGAGAEHGCTSGANEGLDPSAIGVSPHGARQALHYWTTVRHRQEAPPR